MVETALQTRARLQGALGSEQRGVGDLGSELILN